MFQNAHTHVMQNEHILQMICIKMKMIQETFHIMINVSNICFILYLASLELKHCRYKHFSISVVEKLYRPWLKKLHRIYHNVNLHSTLNAFLQRLLYSNRIYLLELSFSLKQSYGIAVLFFTLQIYFYILKMQLQKVKLKLPK